MTTGAAVLDTIGRPAPTAQSRPLRMREVELAPAGDGDGDGEVEDRELKRPCP